jgi:hypothetical protein
VASEHVARILDMKASGHSIARIAQILNLPEWKVTNKLKEGHGMNAGIDYPDHDRPPKKCPGCGYLVYMPCLICTLRNHQERRRIKA